MLPAVRFYTYSKRFEEAYTAAMRPLTEELDMAQPAVDILLFLANNPGMDTARDICTYRHLKPAIVSFHVEKLAGEGYLERQPVPGDRRKCRLVCTEKAEPVADAIAVTCTASLFAVQFRKALRKLDAED